MQAKYEIKGTTDEVCTCDCCGRTDLKYTVIMSLDGDVSYFGRVCATRHAGIPAKEVESSAKGDDRVAAEAKRSAQYREEKIADDRFAAFLASKSSKSGRCLQIEELGGFRKARAMFEAD